MVGSEDGGAAVVPSAGTTSSNTAIASSLFPFSIVNPSEVGGGRAVPGKPRDLAPGQGATILHSMQEGLQSQP